MKKIYESRTRNRKQECRVSTILLQTFKLRTKIIFVFKFSSAKGGNTETGAGITCTSGGTPLAVCCISTVHYIQNQGTHTSQHSNTIMNEYTRCAGENVGNPRKTAIQNRIQQNCLQLLKNIYVVYLLLASSTLFNEFFPFVHRYRIPSLFQFFFPLLFNLFFQSVLLGS